MRGATFDGDLRRHWTLDPAVVYLNHGSYGACPRPVLEAQRRLRERMESQPVQFFVRDLERLLDRARTGLADFLNAAPEDIAWVNNATAGVNAVLRSLDLKPDDELIITDHAYNACRNALDYVARKSGSRVVVAPIPFPLDSADVVIDSFVSRVTDRTRLALIDHVTSPTGLVLPVERLVSALSALGVDTLIDGAHAPGMLELDIKQLAPTYYTGNCHKWLCAPKGAGFLYVRRDRQRFIHPVAISHGANSARTDRSRFLMEFDWTGTDDPTAALCVPHAIDFLAGLQPGAWQGLRSRNHQLVLAGRRMLAETLDLPMPCPEAMIGSLASLPLPARGREPESQPFDRDPLQDRLLTRWGIEVPIIPWPEPPNRLLRISAQVYNSRNDYKRLCEALVSEL
jgi:isopenicillin-N epimerase